MEVPAVAKRTRRAQRASKAVIQAAAFEVVDRTGRAVARLGPMPGCDVDEPGVGLVFLEADGTARLTIGVDTSGPALHLMHDGTVRCTIAVLHGERHESLVLVAVRDASGREVASLIAGGGRV
jgi:hypothetical protein